MLQSQTTDKPTASWEAGPRSLVGNVSDCRCVFDCRSRGCEFDPGPVPYFFEIDNEIISTAVLLPSADSRRVVFSYKQKYVHEVLVTRLVKLAQEKKVWLGDPDMTKYCITKQGPNTHTPQTMRGSRVEWVLGVQTPWNIKKNYTVS